MLLGQVLDLEFLLVDRTLVLHAGLLFPLSVDKVAFDGVCAIFLSKAIVDSYKCLVLSV